VVGGCDEVGEEESRRIHPTKILRSSHNDTYREPLVKVAFQLNRRGVVIMEVLSAEIRYR
jgi:hypothetical protein